MKKDLRIAAAIFVALNLSSVCNVQAQPVAGAPKIQFETTNHDFGKITSGETLSGAFKFKNTGNAVLKVEPPEPNCECTHPYVNPDTIAPGGTGEILYNIDLERAINGRRLIKVRSNDPETPALNLSFTIDYTPVYELNPKTLRIVLPADKTESQATFTVTRADGKPLDIDRFKISQDWISAAIDPSFKPEQNSAQINVTVHRPPGSPAPINATVEMWDNNQSARPVQTMQLTGEIMGEISATPPRVYWVIPDLGKDKANYPEAMLTRKVVVTSVLGHPLQPKNATCDITGLSVQIAPRETGKTIDLILKLDTLPTASTNGEITLDTSLESMPQLKVPVTVTVAGAR